VIPDIHPGCGPLGGIEAALVSRRAEWSLFTPVDMPFLPSKFLTAWVNRVSGAEEEGARVSMFMVSDRPQPVPCLVHREVTPFIRRAVEAGELKLYPVLEGAARAFADEMNVSFDCVLRNVPWSERTGIGEGERDMLGVSKAQMDAKHLWFANLNTREEFTDAEKHLDALDFPLKSNVLG
jgi:molybdopterin-guanine dinucleotide biosynthesis protein A